MTRHDTPIEVALKGASAGLAGTLVLTVAMRAVAELIASLPRSQTEPRGSQAGVAPPAQLVGKIAQGLFERDLPPAVQSVLGQTLHWTYGAVWGGGVWHRPGQCGIAGGAPRQRTGSHRLARRPARAGTGPAAILPGLTACETSTPSVVDVSPGLGLGGRSGIQLAHTRRLNLPTTITPDGAAIHYNWWGPPYGFGRPGSHGCLGMKYDDSKFYWDWADIGVPIVVHA